MPRKTKDEEVKKVTNKGSKKVANIEVEEKSTSIKKASTLKSKTSSSKSSVAKSSTTKTSSKKVATPEETTKKSPAKKATTSKSTVKKATTKKATTSKSTTKKTTASKNADKKSSAKKAKPVVLPEYYDLPTVYNRTIVKILAQTPSSLFVYWEVSEDDRKKLQQQYGEEFFQNTKPYLVITNETMHYSFETEINDYANSWYIPIHDTSCKYSIQLIRKSILSNPSTSQSIVSIISSNKIATPNDHILFDKLGKTVFFRDVKSNHIIEKNISTLSFISNIGRIYNIYDLYKEMYKNELNGDELGMKLPSSGFSSNFI